MKTQLENYEEKESLPILLNQIKQSLKDERYLIALMASLCIPDILGSLEYDGKPETKYANWFNANVKNEFGCTYDSLDKDFKFSHINGTVIYNLRNKMIHKAFADEIKTNDILIDEFVLVCNQERFTRGHTSGYKYDESNLKIRKGVVIPNSQYLYISVYGLCMEIVEAAELDLKKRKAQGQTVPTVKVTKYGGKVPTDLLCK